MKRNRIVTLTLFLGFTFGFTATTNLSWAKHADDKDDSKLSEHPLEDSALTSDTIKFGAKYFVYPATEERFKHDFGETQFDGKTIYAAINEIKPRVDEDGQKVDTTKAQEMPLARAMANMMFPLTQSKYDQAATEVTDLLKSFNKKASPDSQFEALIRRMHVALDNWDKDRKTDKWADHKPADKDMIPFYEAFKDAKKEAQDTKAEMKKLVAAAAAGNEDAKRKLLGDKDNKDGNAEVNKWAVGPHVTSYISQLIKEGNKKEAWDYIKALSDKSTNLFSYNDSHGAPKFFSVADKEKALKAFASPDMEQAQFVGHPHDANKNPETMDWKNGAFVATKAQPTTPVAGGVNGATTGANAATPQTAQGTGPVASSDGAQLFNQKCAGCHDGTSRDGHAAIPSAAGAKIRMAASGRQHMPRDPVTHDAGETLSPGDQATIVAWLQQRASGQVASQ